MEETPVDRAARRRSWIGFAFFLAYIGLVVYLLINPPTRIIGIFNVVVVAFMLSHYLLKWGMEEPQHWWRKLVYRGWHGKYRAFEDRRVRVLDGERESPSQVFAADIFDILGQSPSDTELAKLAARYGTGFVKGAEDLGEGEWLFSDEACMAYIRGHGAHKLALWLERSVFMPIDNRRTAATGKTYAFTKEAARR